MEIRRATPRDFLAIAALDRDAWRGGKAAEFIPDGEHAWRIWVEHALVYCAGSGVGEGWQLAGAVLAFPAIEGSYCLHKAFVDVARRGQGIGGALFEVLLREIDELRVPIFLTVSPDNTAAVALYEKWGFTERTFVSGYYRPNEHRLVLTRPTRGGPTAG
jgi:ribosomal-protein-alanine N-acetyltransferase